MNNDEWIAKLIPTPKPPAVEPVPVVEEIPKTEDHHRKIEASSAKIAAVVSQNFPPPPAAASLRINKIVGEEMPNLGILEPFMQDQEVTDILVNGTHSIFIGTGGKLVDSKVRFETQEDVWKIGDLIVKSVGQRLSHDRPMIDSRLPDGSRVNIVAPPMAIDGMTISIRKFPSRQITLESMVSNSQLTPELAKFLSICVRSRLNIIVCGGTGSGKTTLLNVLSASIDPEERVITIEDSAELRLQQPHVVRLEAKHTINADKAHHSVSIRDLVRNALRMSPDRIIVGESRGPEALDVLQAMNTGHDGSMTTLHANSSRDALSRLETMVSMAMPQLPIRLVRQQVASTVNIIINMARCKDGVRRIMQITEVAGMEGEIIVMQDLIVYNEAANGTPGQFRWANASPRHPLIVEAARNSGLMRSIR